MIPLKDENPTRTTPVVTILLIAACVATFFLVQPGGKIGIFQPAPADTCAEADFLLERAAIPREVTRAKPLSEEEVERLKSQGFECPTSPGPDSHPDKPVFLAIVVSMFLHGGLLHLAGNMLYLWVFGNNIEDTRGKVEFIVFYLLSGLAATIAHVLVQPSSPIPVVGASGAIAGVMGAYLVLFPKAPIRTLFTLFFIWFVRDVRAWVLLGFWFISQFFVNPNAGVAWMAHVGGFVFGVGAGLLWRAVSPRPPRRRTPAYEDPW